MTIITTPVCPICSKTNGDIIDTEGNVLIPDMKTYFDLEGYKTIYYSNGNIKLIMEVKDQ